MKTLIKIAFALFIIISAAQPTLAQQTKKEKRAAKDAAREIEVKQLIADKNFVFEATYMYPLGGGQRYINNNYDLVVGKDTVVAFLPYFGVAYANAGYNTNEDNGIKFTSTKFSYQSKANDNGSYDILIKPTDSRTTSQLILTVAKNGNADLSVVSNSRQRIRFDGYIHEKVKTKK